MQEVKYRVIIDGVIQGFDPETVKTNIAGLFRMNVSRAERFFPGKPVVIKDNMNEEPAQKLKNMMRKAGADCFIEMSPESEPVIVRDLTPVPQNRPVIEADDIERGKEIGRKAYGKAKEATGLVLKR